MQQPTENTPFIDYDADREPSLTKKIAKGCLGLSKAIVLGGFFGLVIAAYMFTKSADNLEVKEKWLTRGDCNQFSYEVVAAYLSPGIEPVGEPSGPMVQFVMSLIEPMPNLNVTCYVNMCDTWDAYYENGKFISCPASYTADHHNLVGKDPLYLSNDLVGNTRDIAFASFVSGVVLLVLLCFLCCIKIN